MKSLQRFARNDDGNVFAGLGGIVLVALLMAILFINLSRPDIPSIVEKVTVGQVLAIGQDGMADGIAMPEKPARLIFIGDKQ